MDTAIHYLVKAKLIRYQNADSIDFFELQEPFTAANPIEARDAAFRCYQNYLDVLLNSLGLDYTTDKEARVALLPLIETGTSSTVTLGGKEVTLSDSWDNGIGVYLVLNEVLPGLEYLVRNDLLIHGIGRRDWAENPQRLMDGLTTEYSYYEAYRYDTQGREIVVNFWEEDMREPQPNTILPTPFDWSGYDLPPEEETEEWWEARAQSGTSLEAIIRGGEGNQVEFKPTLLYNFKTGGAAIGVKAIIAKTICVFLNSNGGYLFIGLRDDGGVQGLGYDYSLAGEKAPKDFFSLEFDDMLRQFLPPSAKSLISGAFYELEDKEVFVVVVQPSQRGPVFFKGPIRKRILCPLDGLFQVVY